MEILVPQNSISGQFDLKLHANFQGLIDLMEPLIREKIGVADTTNVQITFIRVYPKHLEGHIFMMSTTCRAICSTPGCCSKEHYIEIEHSPEIFVKVNKILKSTGLKLNINIDVEAKVTDISSTVDDRFEILDL